MCGVVGVWGKREQKSLTDVQGGAATPHTGFLREGLRGEGGLRQLPRRTCDVSLALNAPG